MEFKKFIKIRREKFGAVVFDTLREKVFVTNETGAETLGLLQDKIPPADIPSFLAKRFSADTFLIENDVKDFIKGLIEKDLVTE